MATESESVKISFSITKYGFPTRSSSIEVIVVPTGVPGHRGYFPMEESTYQALICPQSSFPQRPSGEDEYRDSRIWLTLAALLSGRPTAS